jgi:hypothetical protein
LRSCTCESRRDIGRKETKADAAEAAVHGLRIDPWTSSNPTEADDEGTLMRGHLEGRGGLPIFAKG